jgi:hypothetical protein
MNLNNQAVFERLISGEIMETIRPYLEALYFITGGPILALFALFALKQITVARENSKIQSLRDAYRLSAEQVHFYTDQIIPGLNEIDRVLDIKKLEYLQTVDIKITSEGIEIKGNPTDEDIEKMIEMADILVPILNRMEVFSLFFTSKLAAENVAFSSLGSTFTHSVEKLLPMILPVAKGKNYKNILNLFYLWHQRLEAEELEQQSVNLREKMRSIRLGSLIPIGVQKTNKKIH